MEPIEGSETSAFKPQTPRKYPKENILHKEHGESLKSRQTEFCLRFAVQSLMVVEQGCSKWRIESETLFPSKLYLYVMVFLIN